MKASSFEIHTNIIEWIKELLRKSISRYFFKINRKDIYLWEITIEKTLMKIYIPVQDSFYKGCNIKNMPTAKWSPWLEGYKSFEEFLFAPGEKKLNTPLIQYNKDNIFFNYDFLGFSYWMMNRCEELNPNKLFLDKFDRFKADSSHAFKNNYLHRPVVDEWFEIFKEVLKRLNNNLKLKKESFKISLTHDVDEPSLYTF